MRFTVNIYEKPKSYNFDTDTPQEAEELALMEYGLDGGMVDGEAGKIEVMEATDEQEEEDQEEDNDD